MNKIEFISAKYYSVGWSRKPEVIVIHWIAGSYKSAINTFKLGTRKASAHYVLDVDGKIMNMVKLENRAWHAGESYLENFGNSANEYSIGIELAGPPSILNRDSWSDEQIKACAELCNYIAIQIPSIKYITDHSTISPGRKIDVKKGTGKKQDVFPWDKLVNMTNLISL